MSDSLSEFTAVTPHGANGQLGRACNEAIYYSPTEWTLLFDADVLLKCHPNWRHVCAEAIKTAPDAGLFTCWTNAIWAKKTAQPLVPPNPPDSMAKLSDHVRMARDIWRRHGYSVTEIKDPRVGGFFHLTNKTAWIQADGYPGKGQFEEDHEYCRRLKDAGYKLYRIDGLYVYHMGSCRGHREKTWVEGDVTAREIWQRV